MFAIAHARYITIQTWLRGFTQKIANFSRLDGLTISRRDWSTIFNIANLGYLVEGGSEIYYVVDRDGGAVATRGRNTGC